MSDLQRPDEAQTAATDRSAAAALVFVHIPKCAGSSFRAVLKRWYGRDALFLDARSPDELALVLKGRDRPPRAVAGHFRFGIHAALGARPLYVALVRDPLDRFVSLYRHLRSVPDHPFHETAASMDIEAFYDLCLVDPRLRGQTVGIQCHFLSLQRTFDAARPVIDANYAVLAPTERYLDFVAACSRLTGEPVPARVEARNVADRNDGLDGAREALAARITQDHREDELLYRYVASRFDEALASLMGARR